MNKPKQYSISQIKENDKLRNYEFIGDSLLSFIVRDYFFKKDVQRTLLRNITYDIVSNSHLANVFDNLKLELNPGFRLSNTLSKAKANQVEYYIYELYNKTNLETTQKFVIENIIGFYYLKKNGTKI